jgi:hypothetical protein
VADAGGSAHGQRGHRGAARPRLSAGQSRLTMLLGCYGMFGLSLIASLLVL